MASKVLGRLPVYVNRAGTRLSSSHAADPKSWKNYTIFIALPSIVALGINWQMHEKEHLAHYKRQEFHPYEHMRIRNKEFPWGSNKSLFHNKNCALPDGYEDEIEDSA